MERNLRRIRRGATIVVFFVLLFLTSLANIEGARAEGDTSAGSHQSAGPRTTVVPNLVLAGSYEQAEFSPDGSILALSNGTGIQIWDRASSKLLRTFRYFAYFNQFHFLPDGSTIVSVQKDGTIKLWNVETGAVIATLPGADAPSPDKDPVAVFAAAVDQQGSLLVSGNATGEIRVWDLPKRQLIRKFKAPGDEEFKILGIKITDDNSKIIATAFQRAIIFDLVTGDVISSFALDEKYSFDGDGLGGSVVSDNELVVTDEHDCQALAYVHLNAAGQPEAPVRFYSPVCTDKEKGSYSSAPHVLRTKDGKFLVSSGEKSDLKMWSPMNSQEAGPIGWTPSTAAQAIALSPDGKTILMSEKNGVTLRDLKTGAVTNQLRQEAINASGLITSPSHEFVAIYDAEPSEVATNLDIRVWKAQSISPSKVAIAIESPYDRDQFSLFELSNDGTSTLRANDKGEIIFNSAVDGHELRRLRVPGAAGVADARLSPNGKFLLANVSVAAGPKGVDGDTSIQDVAMLIDAMSGAVLLKHSPAEAESRISTLSFSADSSKAIIAFWNGTAVIWDTRTRRPVGSLKYDESVDSAIFSIALSGDGRYLIGGQRDTGLSIWDIATGKLVHNFQFNAIAGHVNVACVAISHDGKLVAGGLTERALSSGDIGRERGVKVWDVKSGQLLFSLDDHEMGVASVAFSADDRYIISASYDGTVRYWDRRTGKWLATSASARSGEWLTITESGFYAASEGNTRLVNVVRGLRPFSVAQFVDHLYRPDLVQELLKGDPEGKYADAASQLNLEKILDSGPAPQIDEIPGRKTELIGDGAKIVVRLTDTGGGIGDKVVWRVNGVTQGEVRALQSAPATTRGGYELATQVLRLDPSKKNVIEITAYNEAGLLATEPYRIEIDKFGATIAERSRMYVLAVGISDYAKADWRLKYAADDAKIIGETFKGVAHNLYGAPKVIPLLDKDATAKGISAAIDSLKEEVKPADVFVLYVAGHGRSIAGTYYFLPQDLTFDGGQTIMSGGVSQDMLQTWLAKIAAQKSILILDTCESAAARGSDAAQETAVDRLQHATGRSVITAASSSAFEGYKGHGLLTYAILDELTRTEIGTEGNEVTLWKLASYVKDQVPRISQQVFGERQEPHNSVGDDFPLGERIAAIAKPAAESEIVKAPTHVLIREERVRELPRDDAAGARVLTPGAQVRVVALTETWAMIAVDGQKLGYVPLVALAALH